VGLGGTAAVLGARRPGLSAFEILNAIGGVVVAAAYAVPAIGAVRRRLGGGWLRLHVRLVLTSLAFIAVAALNQLAGPALHALGLSYPRWAFWLLVAAPFGVLPPIGRRLVAGMGTAAARGRPARGAAAPRAGVAARGAA
jgi:MFS-type transporter involved in bile tolerance (Atg22 family)